MVDRTILPYAVQAIMGQYGNNSPVSQYGDEVTALADKSIFDLQNEIDKDQAFRSPFEDLGAVGSKTDFSVYGGTGKGSREKGQMYNLIAGLLSGASSGLGEDLSRESRAEAKDKLVKALSSRDAESLGDDSRMKPYKDKVNLFNERLGGLEARMKGKTDLADKGLKAIMNLELDPPPPPKMNEYQQRMLDLREKEMGFKQNQSSEMAQIRQQVEENKRKEAQGLPTSEIIISRGNGKTPIKMNAETASSVLESGASFNDINSMASEVDSADPTATPDPITQTEERMKLVYGGDGYKVSETESIPPKYAGVGELVEKLKTTGANPKQIEDYVATKVSQIDEADKMAYKTYENNLKLLRGAGMSNPKNEVAYNLLSNLKGSLTNLAREQGENQIVGGLNTSLANIANNMGIGETSELAQVNGLVNSLGQYWLGVTRVAGSGSQSDREFAQALKSFQNPELSLGERIKQVDVVLKNMERTQKALDIMTTAPTTAGYGNTLGYVQNILRSPLLDNEMEQMGGVAEVTPTPTETPAPNQTPIPSYQDYLMLAKGR